MLQEMATRAANHYEGRPSRHRGALKKEVVLGTIATAASISLMTQVIVSVIKIFKACRANAEQVTLRVNTSEIMDKKRLENIVYEQIGWWKWWRFGKKIVDSIIATGSGATLDEIQELLKDVELKLGKKK